MLDKVLVTIASALLVAACTGGHGAPAPDAASCGWTLTWGHRDGGAFVPFHDADSAPITRGFQGFRFIDSTARITGAAPGTVLFRMQATIDGHDPVTQDVARDGMTASVDGALYAENLQLFFNDIPLPDMIGRGAVVVVRASANGCSAQTSVRVTLVDGPCQGPDGGVDDGGATCGDAGL